MGSCLATKASISPNDIYFKTISIKDGLPGSTINDIVQDSLGFIWIGTNDGLCRYDGNEFKIFKNSTSNENSLTGNYIHKLKLDKKGNLWIITENGLNYFDLKSHRIERYSSDENSKSIIDNSATSLIETKNGDIYVGLFYNGLNIKSPENKIFKKVKGNFSGNSINSMVQIGEKKLAIGYTYNGVDIYNTETGRVTPIEKLFKNRLASKNINTLIYHENEIWAGTKNGISCLNMLNGKLKNFEYSGLSDTFIKDRDVLSLMIDKTGYLWIGTRNNGLTIVHKNDILEYGKNAKYYHYTNNYNKGSLSYRTISCMFTDNKSNVWLGTHGEGVNFAEDRYSRFMLLEHQKGEKYSLSYNKVWGLAEDKSGNIWLGTDGGGINVWNPVTNGIKYFTHNPDNKNSLSDNAILCIDADPSGDIWLGTYRGGLNRYDSKRKIFKHYRQGSEIPKDDVRCLYRDNKNNLWVGLNQGGILKYNSERDNFDIIKGLEQLDVRAIVRQENYLWIGTYGNGLVKYNLTQQKVEPITFKSGKFQTNIVFSLLFTDPDKLWIGTRLGGIYHYNLSTDTLSVLTETNGLVNNTVHAMLFDNHKYIWLTTNRSISRLNIETLKFQNFDYNYGVQSAEFHNGSGIITKKGMFCFGGINGMNYFYPDKFLDTKSFSEIQFTELKVLNSEVLPENSKIINQSIEYNPTVNLNYNDAVVSVKFQLIGYPFSKNINYQYKLSGYDKTWINSGKKNSAVYKKIPPGEYELKVRTTSQGENIKNKASLKIVVKPPLWKTIWAYIVYIIILAYIVRSIFRYRVNRFKIKNELAYQQRIRNKENKIHNERLEFFTNISHELRTPITIINCALDELSVSGGSGTDKKRSLNAAISNSNRLMELINKLLEFRRTETGMMSLNVKNVNLNMFLPDFLQGFREVANQKHINFKLTLPIENIWLWIDPDKFSIILNNLLSNAFKHTPESGVVQLSIDEDEFNIIIKVSDTGSGIPNNIKQKIFKRYFKTDSESTSTGIGLALTKSLIEFHHGDIEVESNQNRGSEFTVKFLKGNNHYTKSQLNDEEYIENKSEEVVENSDVNIEEINKKIVLLIDDNTEIINLLSTRLEQDYHIMKAYNGEDGLKLAFENVPDLIITDIMMPGIDGNEVCNNLKSHPMTSHVPVIMLTAKTSETDEITGLNTGADDYISKPFKMSILEARIQSLINNRIKIINYFSDKKVEPEEPTETPKATKEIDFLNSIEEKILEKCMSPDFSVFTLAADMGYSRTTLYRKIKSLTGLSINSFIRSVKLKKAATLISEGLNVSEAAYVTGFNDLKHFRECFKELFGKNPSEMKGRV